MTDAALVLTVLVRRLFVCLSVLNLSACLDPIGVQILSCGSDSKIHTESMYVCASRDLHGELLTIYCEGEILPDLVANCHYSLYGIIVNTNV